MVASRQTLRGIFNRYRTLSLASHNQIKSWNQNFWLQLSKAKGKCRGIRLAPRWYLGAKSLTHRFVLGERPSDKAIEQWISLKSCTNTRSNSLPSYWPMCSDIFKNGPLRIDERLHSTVNDACECQLHLKKKKKFIQMSQCWFWRAILGLLPWSHHEAVQGSFPTPRQLLEAGVVCINENVLLIFLSSPFFMPSM